MAMPGTRRLLFLLTLVSAGCRPPPSAPTPHAPASPAGCARDALTTALAERARLQLGDDLAPIVGATVCRDLGEGERLRTHFTVQPDRGYAILAHTLPGVDAIDLVLWADVPVGNRSRLRLVADTVLAQDDGLVATIGAGDGGYRFDVVPGWTEPVPVVAEAKVVAGEGPVALAPYEGP